MSRKSRPSVSIASTTAVEQVVAMIDAGYWNRDEEGYRAALLCFYVLRRDRQPSPSY